MSANLNYKQVANVERRTWDVDTYEKRARERAKHEESGQTPHHHQRKGLADPATSGAATNNPDDDANREEFVPAATGAAGPHRSQRAFLKARSNKVGSLDSKIGSVEMINADAAATVRSNVGEAIIDKDKAVTKSGVGWHCKVCDCFLRDSHAYLDHINGRKHQRNLGYSMRVERSTNEEVISRLAVLAKEKEKSKQHSDFDEQEEEEDYHDIVKAKDEELRRIKEERKRERKERRKKKKEQPIEEGSSPTQDEEEKAREGDGDISVDEEEGGIDPNLASMMGFSGFGGRSSSS